MNTLTHKGYGRIYVQKPEDIAVVEQIMEEIDPQEFEGYYPEGLVTTFDQYPEVIYTGKYSDINMDVVTAIAWSRGVPVFVLDTGRNDYIPNAVKIHNDLKANQE